MDHVKINYDRWPARRLKRFPTSLLARAGALAIQWPCIAASTSITLKVDPKSHLILSREVLAAAAAVQGN
jgi:hypothetical protein